MQLCRALIVAPKKLGNGSPTCSWCNCYRSETHVYKVRPRKDKRGVDLVADALPLGRLWYDGPNVASNAIGYASHYSRSHDAVIRVYDAAGNLIETHEHKGYFKEW